MRTAGDQLAVAGQGDAPFGWVAGEGGLGGDQAVGHQALGQAGLAVGKPIGLCVVQAHAECGSPGQIVWVETQARQ